MNKKIVKIIVDSFMLATLIVTLATMRGDMLVHTIFGGLFVLFAIIHIWQTRKWTMGIAKRITKVKPKIRRQFIVNMILIMAWLVCIATGIVIGIEVVAGLDHVIFIAIRRVHGVTGVIACVVTIVHAIQHRQRLVALLKRKKRVHPQTQQVA